MANICTFNHWWYPNLGKYNIIDQFGQGRIINPNTLLQLQLFSQIFEILDPPFILSWLGVSGFMNSVLFFPLLQFGLKWGQLLSCFSKNCFLFANALTVEFWKWCLFGLNDFLHRYRKSVYVRVGACFSLLSLFRRLNELISSLPSLNLLNT